MTTADIADGQKLYLVAAEHRQVKLGAGFKSKGVYEQVERITGVSMLDYLDASIFGE